MPDPRPFPQFTPEQRQELRERAARFFKPMPEEDDVSMWIDATPEERGRTLASLLRLVDRIGHFPPKFDEFPGFVQPTAKRAPKVP